MRRLPPTKAEVQEAFRHLDRMAEHQTSAYSEALDTLRRRIVELEAAYEFLANAPEPEGHGTFAPDYL